MKSTRKELSPIPRELIMIAWILVLGSFAPMLDSTMVNIAIHRLSRDFQASLSVVQWTTTGFMLAMGASIPFSGWLVNRFSAKKVYLYAELAFGGTSFLSGIAWNINSLILFRLLQGLASGLIMPLFITILVDLVGGGDRVGRIMAIVGVPMTLGPMVGPIIGGLIIQSASWRWLFFINIPVTILAALLLVIKVPDIKPKNKKSTIDLVGILSLAAGSGTIVYGVVQASTYGTFNNLKTIGFSSSGIALFIFYVGYAVIRHDKVVLPLHLFKYRNFSGSMLGTFLAGFITSGPMLLLPLFFQDIRGENVIMAAVALVPQSIGMLISRGIIRRLIDTIGARWVVLVGVMITVFSTLPFAYFNHASLYWIIAGTLFIRGIGGAAVKTATQADAFVGIDKGDSASVSLSSNLFQQVGSGFSSAVLATIVANYIRTNHIVHVLDLTSAYQNGFFWATVLTAVSILPGLLLTNKLK